MNLSYSDTYQTHLYPHLKQQLTWNIHTAWFPWVLEVLKKFMNSKKVKALKVFFENRHECHIIGATCFPVAAPWTPF